MSAAACLWIMFNEIFWGVCDSFIRHAQCCESMCKQICCRDTTHKHDSTFHGDGTGITSCADGERSERMMQDHYDEVKEKLVLAVKQLKSGDPRQEDTFIGPLISQKEAERVDSWVSDALSKGTPVLFVSSLAYRAALKPKGARFWEIQVAHSGAGFHACHLVLSAGRVACMARHVKEHLIARGTDCRQLAMKHRHCPALREGSLL